MATAMTQTETMMTALFRDRDNAENAYGELLKRGYRAADISVLMSDATRNRYYNNETVKDSPLGDKASEGTATGSIIGGTIGAVVASIAAIGTNILLPGLGLIVWGPFAAALAGAGAGGATGGIIGALVGSGVPEETAQSYQSGLGQGGIVLGFRPRTSAEAAEVTNVWKNYNGESVYSLTN